LRLLMDICGISGIWDLRFPISNLPIQPINP
jgi:hypothetical protein